MNLSTPRSGTSFSPSGPDGIVIWGSSLPFRRHGFCANVTNYLIDTLGPYLRHAYYDECESSPCLNDGTCTDALFSFKCACTRGFGGRACELVVDPCATRPCRHRDATCIVTTAGRNIYAAAVSDSPSSSSSSSSSAK